LCNKVKSKNVEIVDINVQSQQLNDGQEKEIRHHLHWEDVIEQNPEVRRKIAGVWKIGFN
jgi:hypothetical protein